MTVEERIKEMSGDDAIKLVLYIADIMEMDGPDGGVDTWDADMPYGISEAIRRFTDKEEE